MLDPNDCSGIEARWQANERELNRIYAAPDREMLAARIDELEAEQDAIDFELGCDGAAQFAPMVRDAVATTITGRPKNRKNLSPSISRSEMTVGLLADVAVSWRQRPIHSICCSLFFYTHAIQDVLLQQNCFEARSKARRLR
jgi:hypothetical protein